MNERNFHIYIVREGQKRQKNYFKIGSSSSCKTNRLSALQISNPRELFLVKKIKDNRHLQKLEPYLHKNLENYHKRGEWFYLNEDILFNECDAIIQQFNSLSDLDIFNIKYINKPFCNPTNARKNALKSNQKRRQSSKKWGNNLYYYIVDAIRSTDNPTQASVVKYLNDKKVFSRTGKPWLQVTFSHYLIYCGFNWKEMKKIK
jgi:hypothetical protein